MDLLTDSYPFFSPYLYAGNEPIGNIDFMGMGPETGLTAATGKVLGEVVLTSVSRSTQTASIVNGLSKVVSITSISFKTFLTVSNVINTNITTQPVGGVYRSEPEDYILVNTKTKQVASNTLCK